MSRKAKGKTIYHTRVYRARHKAISPKPPFSAVIVLSFSVNAKKRIRKKSPILSVKIECAGKIKYA